MRIFAFEQKHKTAYRHTRAIPLRWSSARLWCVIIFLTWKTKWTQINVCLLLDVSGLKASTIWYSTFVCCHPRFKVYLHRRHFYFHFEMNTMYTEITRKSWLLWATHANDFHCNEFNIHNATDSVISREIPRLSKSTWIESSERFVAFISLAKNWIMKLWFSFHRK